MQQKIVEIFAMKVIGYTLLEFFGISVFFMRILSKDYTQITFQETST